MNVLCLLLHLLMPHAEAGLSNQTGGLWLELGGVVAGVDRPLSLGVGPEITVGGWFGKYDDALALGRHWGVGVTVEGLQRPLDDAKPWVVAPQVTVHRSIDLLVVGLRGGLSGGPLLRLDREEQRAVGGTVRVHGTVAWRFKPPLALGLRLHAGVDVENGQASPTVGLTTSLQWFGRLRQIDTSDGGSDTMQ